MLSKGKNKQYIIEPMEQTPPEQTLLLPALDILKQQRDNPLFWFIKDIPDEKLTKLQLEERSESVALTNSLALEAKIESVGQDPENKLNEDDVLILPLGENRIVYAVIDGVSSKVALPGLPEGITGGFYISHLISLGFPKSKEYQDLLTKTAISPKEIMVTINQWVRSEFERLKIEGLNYNTPESIPGVSATLTLLDGKSEKFRLADIADTMAIGKTKKGLYKMLTNDQNAIFDQKVMGEIIKISEESGLTVKEVIDSSEHSPTIKRLLLEASREKINTPNGCGILNGQPELVTNNLIEEPEYNINDFDEMWLISDGAMLAFPEVVSLLLSKPEGVTEEELRQVLVKVRETNQIPETFESLVIEGAVILQKDPQRTRIPRFKDKDDATTIRIKIKRV